jgi:hypothetical protein
MKLYGFSLKRLIGISGVKRKISKTTGIPMTKTGREQMVGRAVLGLFKGGK